MIPKSAASSLRGRRIESSRTFLDASQSDLARLVAHILCPQGMLYHAKSR
jgi:hypothetical protein